MLPSVSGLAATIQSVNPSTGELLAEFAPNEPREIEVALEAASRASRQWSLSDWSERSGVLRRVENELLTQRDDLARLASVEMGKPISDAVAEIDKCISVCRYFAEAAERLLSEVEVPVSEGRARVRFDPLGAILAITPWNAPFWQVFRLFAPAVMAGNAVLLKHASNVTLCALALERLVSNAAPPGLFQLLIVDGRRTGPLIRDQRISAVVFTGSSETGARVGALAARSYKKVILELGGSDPFIVLTGADVFAAAEAGARARTRNAGQSCIAPKRFIVQASVADDFVEALRRRIAGLVLGDPLDPRTDVGPVARLDLLEKVEEQLRSSVALGARVELGGSRGAGPGYYFEPTLLTNVKPEMAVAQEEVFGPVAPVIRVDGADDALTVANASPYGLGASVWLSDNAIMVDSFVANIQAGSVGVNGLVASDPRLPFGGIKRSGFGRQLGEVGIRELTNVRTIRVYER